MFWGEGRTSKHGFISRSTVKTNAINIGDISLMIDHNKFGKKGTIYDVNLDSLGYTKLLSKGPVKHPMNITVASATEKAIGKVTQKGGKVNLPNKKE